MKEKVRGGYCKRREFEIKVTGRYCKRRGKMKDKDVEGTVKGGEK